MYKLLKASALRMQFTIACLLATLSYVNIANATLTTDLQQLVADANLLNTNLANISLNIDNSCSELGESKLAVNNLTANVKAISSSLPVSNTLDIEQLEALDSLMQLSTSMSANLPLFSTSISSLALSNELMDVNAAMDAMLSLSDDIGVMANRILEMADKILLMSDNIGAMADRIIITQQIQSSNLALTQGAMLTTQQNIITLAASINSIIYDTPLGSLIVTGNAIVDDMITAQLTETNMSSELADFENRVNIYMDSVVALISIINADSSIASHYINSDTLTMIGDLSVINAALASSINAYASTVNTLAPNTNITILNDSIYSMLRLSSDIGEMGTRIVEMGDRINVMADNIGLMALRIVETQTIQQQNLVLTQQNLKAAQITSIEIIAAFGL